MVEKITYIVEQGVRKYMDIYLMIFDYFTVRIMFGINTKFIEYFGYLFENILYGMESIFTFTCFNCVFQINFFTIINFF